MNSECGAAPYSTVYARVSVSAVSNVERRIIICGSRIRSEGNEFAENRCVWNEECVNVIWRGRYE